MPSVGGATNVLVRGAIVLAAVLGGSTLAPEAALAAQQIPVRHTPADEFAGFAGSGFLGWTQNSPKHRNRYHVFLRDSAANRLKVNRPGTEGAGGGIDGSTLVYEEATRNLNRLVLYDVTARSYTNLPISDSRRAGMHPTISGAWILYTEGVRDRRTSVRLYNRITGERRQLGRVAARGQRRFVYSGQVAGDWAVWGRVLRRTQDVFLTNLATGQTTKINRPRGVKAQYNPAVTPTGTVFFVGNVPCARRCKDTPGLLVEQRLGKRPRVAVTLRKGQNAGYMYATPQGTRVRLLYGRFNDLPNEYVTYGDIFAFTVPS